MVAESGIQMSGPNLRRKLAVYRDRLYETNQEIQQYLYSDLVKDEEYVERLQEFIYSLTRRLELFNGTEAKLEEIAEEDEEENRRLAERSEFYITVTSSERISA